MMKTSTCIYHFIVMSWYIFLNYYVVQVKNDPKTCMLFKNGGQWKYLTFLNLLLQAIFFGVVCLDDVLKRIKGKKDIKFITAFRDLLFSSLVFPVSTFVFLAFWSLFLYDRDFIYPKILDTFIPIWFNHAMHTFILSFSLIEIAIKPHHYPSKKIGFIVTFISSFFYTTRVLWIYFESGTWVYPLFAKLSPVNQALFFFVSYIFVFSFYLLGEKLNHWKWGDVMQAKKGE
ncbi:androgen-dependent TFPI-regulating protein isoform X1 [Erinaceus europaeus]|uniref:Androgen-dependent TFPI-regulating protein isoform X1 n=1 Tax=Erinaceus europaeus TaxID=9365 RepID=A0A1S3AR75_ERIEU|nr:androgen-dependent TFPI-regulating protein isoform X1 [Erinaceus europaeus]XP_060046873.1 androgen-dependent TFPI-regulating protein isoform X1 [Erinaceus europaeus]